MVVSFFSDLLLRSVIVMHILLIYFPAVSVTMLSFFIYLEHKRYF